MKELFKRSISNPRQTHILMKGPPASAKSVILLECARLPYSYYLLGGRTSKAGLGEVLIEHQPSYLLIDELEKMKAEDLTILLSLMDPGIIKVVLHRQRRVLRLNTNVYAACNKMRKLAPELLSRFQFKLSFPYYSPDEFLEVSFRVLTKTEGIDESLARFISVQVNKYSRDVRDCVGIARLAKDEKDVIKLIKVQRKYSTLWR